MSHGRFNDPLSDDDSALDVSDLPSEYRVKLNGFLRSACNDGHETLARILLDKGADVNYITTNTQLPTALHVAVSNTRDRILPILLPQASSATIQAALQYAIQYRARLANIIRILQQDSGATVESSDNLDKDLDKNTVDSPKKSEIPEQKETETQTTSPPQKENETQTNGDTQTRQQSDTQTEQSHTQQPSAIPSPVPATTIPPPSAQEPVDTKVVKEESEGAHAHQKHEIDIKRLQEQLHEQQLQLQEQQHKLQAQGALHEEVQRNSSQSQVLVEEAKRDVEEMRTKVQKQEELIETQNKQVKQLDEHITAQEAQAQAQAEQLATQVDLTQRLTNQLATHEVQTQRLSVEVREQLDQIEHLKKRIEELEGENKGLVEKFENEQKKSETSAQEFQNQIAALQKDIESKTKNIESISKERDSERRAKEIAKRFLSSNGSNDSMTLGHTHAIRMGSVVSPTPPPHGDDDEAHAPSSPSFLARIGRSRSAVTNGIATPRGPPEFGKLQARVEGKLSSKSRAKDDMDIASEADKARVRRLVERWEEMKYLELKQ